MKSDLKAKSAGPGVEIHGPFVPVHRVTSGGYDVPLLTVYPTNDGLYAPVIDRRFGIYRDVTKEELDLWVPLIANAMAVAAGFSCHGENSGPVNPYATRVGYLGSLPADLRVIDGGKPEPR